MLPFFFFFLIFGQTTSPGQRKLWAQKKKKIHFASLLHVTEGLGKYIYSAKQQKAAE